jgi:hypothetical protein
MTKFVYQKNRKACLGAVACMIVGKDFDDIVEFFGHDGSESGFNWSEFYRYLLHHNKSVGLNLDFTSGKGYIDGQSIRENDSITVIAPVKSPSLMIAKSWFTDKYNHALYWDGENLYDPAIPMAPVNIDKYKFTHIYPVMSIIDWRIE